MIYGLPYQGSKNKIAEALIWALPDGKRFVDLFGGGGAMCHCAFLSHKFEKILYNDFSPLAMEYFGDAVSRKKDRLPSFVSREDFFRMKDKNGFIRFMWSYGSNGEDYITGDEKKEQRALMYYPKCGRSFFMERLRRYNAFPRFDCEITCGSYADYNYREGDIVYCDIPYEKDGKNCDDYGLKFDNKEFYRWARFRPFPVFFSSYDISENFPILWQKNVVTTFAATNNNCERTEYLYGNAAADRIGINKQLTFGF